MSCPAVLGLVATDSLGACNEKAMNGPCPKPHKQVNAGSSASKIEATTVSAILATQTKIIAESLMASFVMSGADTTTIGAKG